MERFIIVGEQKQCRTCFAFFAPGSAYHERRERRTGFPANFPLQHKDDPRAFCSEAYERKAIDEVRLARIEFQHAMEAA